jgi:alkanesulfonate monooxygenase SsuD/methylene tetrahydromethanopterin reductase-like flavin-dependent oxidoreductase (luciferase family)
MGAAWERHITCESALRELHTIRESAFQEAFQQWKECWERCIASRGEYFEEDGA